MDITARQAITARIRALNAALGPARETYLAEARRRNAEGHVSAYAAYQTYTAATQSAWSAYEADMAPLRAGLRAENAALLAAKAA